MHFENQNICETSTQCGQDNFYILLSPRGDNYYNILERSPYTESYFLSPHPHEEVIGSRTYKACCNVALPLGPWMLSSLGQGLGINARRGGIVVNADAVSTDSAHLPKGSLRHMALSSMASVTTH